MMAIRLRIMAPLRPLTAAHSQTAILPIDMPILGDDNFAFGLVDKEFYDSLERYEPNRAEFIAIGRRYLPREWETVRSGIWFHCRPPAHAIPTQGWKIHVSATAANATAILSTVVPILVVRGVSFKFATDRFVFHLLHGKNWTRGGTGKFITIYPPSVEQCGELLETLRDALVGFEGPYVLSDRRYRDSRVVHYRYGGFQSIRRVSGRGELVPTIRGTDGGILDDERTPFFNLPAGLTDPFCVAEEADDAPTGTLKNGRYRIQTALSFSNAGGVYLAHDSVTDKKVLIKEARPHTTQTTRGVDAVALLKKEHRLLTRVAHLNIAPQPIDFFQDWEHFYLVEEYLEGMVLRGFTARFAVALHVAPTQEMVEDFVGRFRRLYSRIAEIVEALHAQHIVFCDLSINNLIIGGDVDWVKLIDFEAAFEEGVDTPISMHTPGFASRQQVEDGPQRADDYFALGGLMLAALMPINGIFALNPKGFESFCEAFVRDLGFPRSIVDLIATLLVAERDKRATPADARRVLSADRHEVRAPSIGAHELEQEDGDTLVRAICTHILSTADYARTDRLFPADPGVFRTNPLGLANGACGIASVLQRCLGTVDPRVTEWILARPLSHDLYPAGLYVGLSGIAWSLLECGHEDRARDAMRLAASHPAAHASPDLFFGSAGCGLALLRFFTSTQDEEFLTRAEAVARSLIDARVADDEECWWIADGAEHCGLGHGGAGVALFLLYLHAITGESEYLDVSRASFRRIASRSVQNPDGSVSWHVQEGHPTVTPYWRWGSAGIGSALLRYRRITGDTAFDALLHGLRADTNRKFSIFPGLHLGLAGLADFNLDLAQDDLARDEARAAAKKALSGTLLFQLERPQGIAFPGETRSRISCDLATGGAGIALTLHRYFFGAPPLFLLDEVVAKETSPASWNARLAAAAV